MTPDDLVPDATAARNTTEAEAEAEMLAKLAARHAASQFVRRVFTRRLRAPLARVDARIARLDSLARKALH